MMPDRPSTLQPAVGRALYHQRCLCRRVGVLQQVSEGGVLWSSEPGARLCYGELKIPPTPSLKVRRFSHGERRREAREEVAVVLAIGHALRAHEALGGPDALPGFLEVVHRLLKDGVFVGHEKSIRAGILRSPDYFTCSRVPLPAPRGLGPCPWLRPSGLVGPSSSS